MSLDIFLNAIQVPQSSDNTLNKLLWYNLKSADNTSSIDLFIVNTFNADESAIIEKALDTTTDTSFSINEYGDIIATNGSNILSFKNKMVSDTRQPITDSVIKNIADFAV